jgi:antitoxin CptB
MPPATLRVASFGRAPALSAAPERANAMTDPSTDSSTDPSTEPDAIAPEQLRRLRWQCRRGMLELDHLLMRFLDLGYPAMDAKRQAEFVALLTQQDQDLSDWFMSRKEPDDPRVAALVHHIVAVASEQRA